MAQSLSLVIEKDTGVLLRVVGLLRKHAVDLESLVVGPARNPRTWRVTVALRDEAPVTLLVGQLDRLVQVLRVKCAPIASETSG